jgi:hypothetical protein
VLDFPSSLRCEPALQWSFLARRPVLGMAAKHVHLLELLDNFYLTAEQLEQSPSRAKGVDGETENRLRIYGCDRIQRAVVLLDLPQVVAATAQILLHRFYSQQDLREWHVRVSPHLLDARTQAACAQRARDMVELHFVWESQFNATSQRARARFGS